MYSKLVMLIKPTTCDRIKEDPLSTEKCWWLPLVLKVSGLKQLVRETFQKLSLFTWKISCTPLPSELGKR